MKEKSFIKKIESLEQQYFRFQSNPKKQENILQKINTLKNTRKK